MGWYLGGWGIEHLMVHDSLSFFKSFVLALNGLNAKSTMIFSELSFRAC